MKIRRVLSAFTALTMLLCGIFSINAYADEGIDCKITYSANYTYLDMEPSDDNHTIYYTTDGSVPTEKSKVYKKTLRTKSAVTIRVVEIDEDGVKVDSKKINLKRKCMTVKAELVESSGRIKLKLSTKTNKAAIYYTLDGSDPTKSSKLYAGPVYVEEGDVVRACAMRTGWKNSNRMKFVVRTEKAASVEETEAETIEAPRYNETSLEILDLINKEREKKGLEPLAMDENLYEAAQIRAKELVKQYDHARPDGSACFTVLDEVGFVYCFAAENIAYTQGALSNPETVMEMWMDSTGHRKNILNTDGDLVGIALVKSGRNTYWVQIFGKKR